MVALLQNISLKPAPTWLENIRRAGREAFLRQGLPTPRTEAWKYTKLREFQTDDYEVFQNALTGTKVSFPFPVCELRYVNGRLSADNDTLPTGVSLKPLSQAEAYLNRLADIEHYPFVALNSCYLEQGFLLEIAPGTKLNTPLAVTRSEERRVGKEC